MIHSVTDAKINLSFCLATAIAIPQLVFSIWGRRSWSQRHNDDIQVPVTNQPGETYQSHPGTECEIQPCPDEGKARIEVGIEPCSGTGTRWVRGLDPLLGYAISI